MADAMVTGRMSKEKKEAGNRVLARLGTNPSAAINGLYDYLIREEKLPFEKEEEFGWQKYSKEEIAEAFAFVRSLRIPVDNRFATMTDDEIKRERLTARGLM